MVTVTFTIYSDDLPLNESASFKMTFLASVFQATFVPGSIYDVSDEQEEIIYINIDEAINVAIEEKISAIMPAGFEFDNIDFLEMDSDSPGYHLPQSALFRTSRIQSRLELIYKITSVSAEYYERHLANCKIIPPSAILKRNDKIYVLSTNCHYPLTSTGVPNVRLLLFNSTGYETNDILVEMPITHPRTLSWDVLLDAVENGRSNVPLNLIF